MWTKRARERAEREESPEGEDDVATDRRLGGREGRERGEKEARKRQAHLSKELRRYLENARKYS